MLIERDTRRLQLKMGRVLDRAITIAVVATDSTDCRPKRRFTFENRTSFLKIRFNLISDKMLSVLFRNYNSVLSRI